MQPLQRYLPFVLLAVVQLLLVIVAPSRPPEAASRQLGGEFQPGTAAPGPTSGGAGTPTGGDPAGGGSGGAASSAAPGASNGQAEGGGGGGGFASDDRKHCVKGLLEPPPCVPAWTGGNNGGSTSMGVSAETVKVVWYRPKENEAVNAILRATGTYTSPEQQQAYLRAMRDFINKNYQLYGRKIQFVFVRGNCEYAPPDDPCFRAEAKQIVKQHQPFAVYGMDVASAFEELSRLGAINLGGMTYTDQFNNRLRPYHYDVAMGGDQQARIFAEFYCKRLANRNARFAGDDYKNTIRKVAIVFPDRPYVRPSAELMMSLINECDPGSTSLSPYSPDTSTAASQATTLTAKRKRNGITSLVWFSDPIAPAFDSKEQRSQDYFPENILAGSGLVDYDSLAQAYDCEAWKHAFGLSNLPKATPLSDDDANRVWKMSGRSGTTPTEGTQLMWDYASVIAWGVQSAGPKLTPLTFERALLTSPGIGGWERTHNPELVYQKFGRGDYTAASDVREVYWAPNKTSSVNGQPGSYVPLNDGRRYQHGQLPGGDLDQIPPNRSC